MPTRALVTSYEQDQSLLPDRWHKVGLALGVALAVAFPLLADTRWITVGNQALTAVVGALGMMILTGFTGQLSLGHAAFLALGAYTVAILGERLQLPFWLLGPAAGAVAAGVGLAVGPFALRLKGLYLAIVTLGLMFLVGHLLYSLPDLTHGPAGIAVPMYSWFGADPARYPMGDMWSPLHLGPFEVSFEVKLYLVFLPLAVGAGLLTRNLRRSNTGRAMMAVRDHDLAAAALGVDPARTKIVAFGVSSFLAGLAGAMFAYQQTYITIEPPFDLHMSVQYIAIIVLGGIGTVFGAVAGALVFVVLSPLAELAGSVIPGLDRLSSAQQSSLIFALLVCGFLLFEPMGLAGIWMRVKRYFAAWPFRY